MRVKCGRCQRPFTDKEIETKKKLKSSRISQARTEAKERGEKVGPDYIYDYDEIRKLRKQGLTVRAIAKQMGCSTSPVSRALKPQTTGDEG